MAGIIFNRFLHVCPTSYFPEALPTLVYCALPHLVLGSQQSLAASKIFESLKGSPVEVLLGNAPLALLAGLAEAAEVIVHED